jgi:hypothetical protein
MKGVVFYPEESEWHLWLDERVVRMNKALLKLDWIQVRFRTGSSEAVWTLT